MNIKIDNNSLIINDPIITMEDAEKVISFIESVANKYDSIILVLNNTFSFPSNIIGVLEKLRDKGKSITILVRDDVLLELFRDLNLDKLFNIRKV